MVHGQTKNKAQPYAPAADVQDPSAQIVRRVAPVILHAASAGRSSVKIAKKVLSIAAVLSATRKFVVTAFRPTNAKRAEDSGVNVAVFEEMLNNMVSMVSKDFKVQAGVNAQAVSDAEAAVMLQTQNSVVKSAIHISVTTVL